MGASILHELTRRGFRNIALLDNGRATISASANSGGMLRAFHENREHLDLALAHLRLLELYQRQGVIREKNSPNGSLYFFDRSRLRSYESEMDRLLEADYPFELLSAVSGRARFPMFRWKSEDMAIFEPEGTLLSPRDFVDDLLVYCGNAGVQILDSFEVRRICPYLDRYRVVGDEGVVLTQALVLAGGARMLPHLRGLGISLPLESKALSMQISKKRDPGFVLPNYLDRETLEFGRLGPGLTAAFSSQSPQRLSQDVLQSSMEDRFEERTAFDCYAPHRKGILGQIPGYPHLYLATGWGGTAFKFSLEIGRRMVDLIERDMTFGRVIYA